MSTNHASLLAVLTALVLPGVAGPAAAAAAAGADLAPDTLAAFERYVAAAERRMDEEERTGHGFLATSAVPPGRRQPLERALRAGDLHIASIRGQEGKAPIGVPDGLIHHWVGVVFVPRATVEQAVALLQDYDRHDEIYDPAVARSKLLSREGDRFRLYLRFFTKKVIAVTIDSEHEAVYTRHRDGRVWSRVHSTRTAEVENAGTPDERQLPPGEGRGFLWRLNSYWRFVPAEGGVWVQCESMTLTRDLPFGLGWIIRPFVTSVPRESLTFTLETTRRVLAGASP